MTQKYSFFDNPDIVPASQVSWGRGHRSDVRIINNEIVINTGLSMDEKGTNDLKTRHIKGDHLLHRPFQGLEYMA